MKRVLIFLICISLSVRAFAQASKPKYRIVIDAGHKERFWNDPSIMKGMNPELIDRANYLKKEITKTSASLNAEIAYVSHEIKSADLSKCDVLFIQIPSAQFTSDEVNTIVKYLDNGGSLFVVMDTDYWSTLKQTNINEIIKPFGILYDGSNPDKKPGGSTKAGVITSKALKISYHEARIVKGGTPFCFNDRSNQFPFGTFKTLKGGGKIIAMGEGMVSLYMTSWESVSNYQCQEFMHDALQWLLKK